MKHFTLLLLPVMLTLAAMHDNNSTTVTKQPTTSGAKELTDLKDIGFAWNLTDWQGHKIDSLTLDIYYPPGATSDKNYPVVLMIHAGGFTGGDKANTSSLCDILSNSGYVCVAMNYRTGFIKNNPHACTADTTTLWNTVYRGMQDVQACLRFVKYTNTKYNFDTSWIFTAGTSAGATLAMNSSYSNDSIARIYFPREYNELGKLSNSGNSYPENYTVKGIGACWGSLFTDKVIDPKYRAYPTILFKGDEDSGLPDSVGYYYGCTNYAPPVYAGVAIYSKLRSVNKASVFYELPGANHPAYDDEFAMSNIGCFFKNIMMGTPYSGRYSYYTPSCPQFAGEY